MVHPLYIVATILVACAQPRQAILVIGQSNAGGGGSGATPMIPTPGEIFDLVSLSWIAYKPGISAQYNGGTFGPEWGIKRVLSGIDIIKVAVGNTAIAERPGINRPRWDPSVRDELFDLIASAIEAANAQIVAVVWIQGEADALRMETAQVYQGNQARLVEAVGDLVGPVPWVVGLPRHSTAPVRPGIDIVRAAITANAQRFGHTVVDLDGYPSSDSTHLTDEGFQRLGHDIGRLLANRQ